MSSEKWTCQSCTYLNYPATVKCVLCRSPRPSQFIEELAPISPPMLNLLAADTSESKWPCHMCTYRNWPKANKCVQCLAPKITSSSSSISPPAAAAAASSSPTVGWRVEDVHQHNPLHMTNSIPTEGRRKSHSPTSSPLIECAPGGAAEAAVTLNELNQSLALLSVSQTSPSSAASSATAKSTCVTCTCNDNWPKCDKCSSCLSNRKFRSGGGSGRHLRQTTPPNTSAKMNSSSSSSSGGCGGGGGGSGSSSIDWLWLEACRGVVDGDPQPVHLYMESGGDVARSLTLSDCNTLDRWSAFSPGHTLIHLAVRFKREDLLAVLLATATNTSNDGDGLKCVPSHVSPETAHRIYRHIASNLRQRKGDFPCYFVRELVTFALPPDVLDLPVHIQDQLFDELTDQYVQDELEQGEMATINWSVELMKTLGSRLYALWNRTAGDCLLDSALQSTWGVFDKDNVLRQAVSDSLTDGGHFFYSRWKEYESAQASRLHFSLDESQWQQDWGVLLSLASHPGTSLEQIHIFVLCHILRRPIIVYGVRLVKSFRGESIGYVNFQGVYLPLLWEPSFCWKSPIALGYTRGHFCALVALEPDTNDNMGASCRIEETRDEDNSCIQKGHTVCLPLVDCEHRLLPVHFLCHTEVGDEERLLRMWMDCCVTDRAGILVAKQNLQQHKPPLVAQMIDDYIHRYRSVSTIQELQLTSSDSDTDDE